MAYKTYTASKDIPHICVKAGQKIKLSDANAGELKDYLKEPKASDKDKVKENAK